MDDDSIVQARLRSPDARRDRVLIEDTGPGLSAEDAARLFERGYRGSGAGGGMWSKKPSFSS